MRSLTILISWALITILVGVAGGGPLLWSLGALSWLAITLVVVRGAQVERSWRQHVAQQAQRDVWAEVLSVASSAQQRQQAPQSDLDQDSQ